MIVKKFLPWLEEEKIFRNNWKPSVNLMPQNESGKIKMLHNLHNHTYVFDFPRWYKGNLLNWLYLCYYTGVVLNVSYLY